MAKFSGGSAIAMTAAAGAAVVGGALWFNQGGTGTPQAPSEMAVALAPETTVDTPAAPAEAEAVPTQSAPNEDAAKPAEDTAPDDDQTVEQAAVQPADTAAPAQEDAKAETPQAPKPEAAPAPRLVAFDEVRREDDGMTIIAGRADPGAGVEVLLDGQPLSEATADRQGKFAVITMIAPDGQGHVLSLFQTVAGVRIASEDQIILAPLAAPVVVAEVAPETEQTPQPEQPQETVAAAPSQAPTESEQAETTALAQPTAPEKTSDAPDDTAAAPETSTPAQVVAEEESNVEPPATPDTPPTETAQVETTQTEISQTEVTQTETTQTESAQAESGQVETAQSEKAEPEITEPETAKPEAAEPETAQIATAEAEPEPEPAESKVAKETQTETAQVEEAEAQPAQPEPVQETASVAETQQVAEADQESGNQETEAAEAEEETTTETAAVAPVAEDPTPEDTSTQQAASAASNAENAPEIIQTDAAESTVEQTVENNATPEAPKPAPAPKVAVLKTTKQGVELLNVPRPEAMENVALDTISYSDAGDVQLSGRAQSDTSSVRVYLNNNSVVSLAVDDQGRWRGDLPDVDEGIYTLRVDEVASDGSVTSRVETPFKREAPEVLAAAAAAADGPLKQITVQKGATLWAIAQDRYGDGLLYVNVFQANADDIRDPDLIYPGQVFELPD